MTIVEIILTIASSGLLVTSIIQARQIKDLKESILIVAKNPAKAKTALREKYGDKRRV